MNRVLSGEKLPIFLWLDYLEDGAEAQARNLANYFDAFKHIAIMPDAHQGFGMPVGGVMATTETVIPNAVGVDIGCGMIAVQTDIPWIDEGEIKRLMGTVRETIPVGFKHNEASQVWEGFNRAPDIEIIQQELMSATRQLGTLGGGNHFIEVQQGSDGFVWLMIHSGSRNIGNKVAREYHNRAVKACRQYNSDIPHKDLSFLARDSKDGREYFEAMTYCQEFALANRELMMDKVLGILGNINGGKEMKRINVHHNFAQMENHFGANVLVHRKGATPAYLGQDGIIPGSMGTMSYIVSGRGNKRSFKSCSHGAGRKMSRSKAKEKLSLIEEQAKMEGIVHGLRGVGNLDEAPGAYKDIEVVMANQQDLVNIEVALAPLGVIKG